MLNVLLCVVYMQIKETSTNRINKTHNICGMCFLCIALKKFCKLLMQYFHMAKTYKIEIGKMRFLVSAGEEQGS